MKTSAVLVNGFFAAFFIYTLIFDYGLPAKFQPIPGLYISKFGWLTMVDLAIQCIYHTCAFVLALTHGTFQLSKARKTLGFLSTAITFPVALTVVVLFWGLYFYDPNTLFKDEETKTMLIDQLQWYNHAIHTIPGIAMFLDFYVWKHKSPSKVKAIKAILIFCVLYLIDIHLIYLASGFWAYPILGQLALPFRMLFIGFCAIIIFAAFLVGDIYKKLLLSEKKAKPKKRRD